MQKNQARRYPPNNLSSHASLLLSTTSPTIISSHLQNNSTNTQATTATIGPVSAPDSATTLSSSSPNARDIASQLPSSITLLKKNMSSTPLSASSNLDNDASSNQDNTLVSGLSDEYINFKKPQNEIFKRLDGKIQKIVAAHSNLNKLYALNDFSGLGVKRPFELPPQLPPPPPWVPKVGGEYACAQWADEAVERLNSYQNTQQSGSSLLSTCPPFKSTPVNRESIICTTNRSTSLTIDSAISKLHQRRQQQQNTQNESLPQQNRQFQQRKSLNSHSTKVASSSQATTPSASSSSSFTTSPKISPAQFSILIQKIKETFESESKIVDACRFQNPRPVSAPSEDKKSLKSNIFSLLAKECMLANQNSKSNSPAMNTQNQLRPKSRFDNVSPEQRRELFQEELVARIKQKLASLASSGLKVNSQQSNPNNPSQIPLSMKCSPQDLFNTIRRETSLLLKKQQEQSLSRSNQHINRQNNMSNLSNRPVIARLHTIKVVVPPTEFYQASEMSLKRERNENSRGERESFKRQPAPSYQVIKNKIKLFQEHNKIPLGKPSDRFSVFSYDPAFGTDKKKGVVKSLDKIVDRLQAKCSATPSPPQTEMSFQQKIISTSANLFQASRSMATISAPTPIPVFRSHQSVASRIVNLKSKKSKRTHQRFGLKINNYLEREGPQPTTEEITIDQFAKCLNLVRANDASLKRKQQQMLQSESRWRVPIGRDRPLRLRRIRGEHVPYMPASASYRATRKVGLQ